jgi:hypothetical protein
MLHLLSVAVVARISPEETVLDGGAAKCKALDKLRMRELEASLGGTRGVREYTKTTGAGARFLEADWVATEHALYYVSHHAGGTRWAWKDIGSLEDVGRGGLSTRCVRLTAGRETYDLLMGRMSTQALLAIGRRYMG